jgi:hypothetical protein
MKISKEVLALQARRKLSNGIFLRNDILESLRYHAHRPVNKVSLHNLVNCLYQPNSLHGRRSEMSEAALGISQTKLVRLTGDMPR